MTLSESGSNLTGIGADLRALADALPMDEATLRRKLEVHGNRAERLANLFDEAASDGQDWRKLAKEAAEINKDLSKRLYRLMKFADQLEYADDADEKAKTVAHDIRCLLNGNEDATVMRFDQAPAFARRARKPLAT